MKLDLGLDYASPLGDSNARRERKADQARSGQSAGLVSKISTATTLSNLSKPRLDAFRTFGPTSYFRSANGDTAWRRRLSTSDVDFQSVRIHETSKCGNHGHIASGCGREELTHGSNVGSKEWSIYSFAARG
jgi:hypothetical protein